MAKYVMGDIHGQSDKFQKLLALIDFKATDELYLLGDVLDRGPDGVKILRQIMKMPNVHLLMGNHEFWFLQKYGKDSAYFDVCSFLASLPLHFEVEENGKVYYLVHGYPSDDITKALYSRPEEDFINPVSGKRLIIGHTPVWDIQNEMDPIEYVEKANREGGRVQIVKTSEYIDLDCGSGYDFPCAALACMRLGDEAEFYA